MGYHILWNRLRSVAMQQSEFNSVYGSGRLGSNMWGLIETCCEKYQDKRKRRSRCNAGNAECIGGESIGLIDSGG